MDKIQAASGERDPQETSQRKKHSSEEIVTHEYALGCLQLLEAFTGKRLDESTAELWVERLSRYPKWRLLRLDGYTGTLNNEVFKFLDEQKRPVYYREDTSGVLGSKSTLGKEVVDHCVRMMGGQGDLDAIEKEFVDLMRKKYPRVNWQCGRKANAGY